MLFPLIACSQHSFFISGDYMAVIRVVRIIAEFFKPLLIACLLAGFKGSNGSSVIVERSTFISCCGIGEIRVINLTDINTRTDLSDVPADYNLCISRSSRYCRTQSVQFSCLLHAGQSVTVHSTRPTGRLVLSHHLSAHHCRPECCHLWC